MKKKKILISCGKLKIGGVQKSLLSLLNNLDFEKFSVTLLLDDKGGELMSEVPSLVNIIEIDDQIKDIHMLKLISNQSIKWFLKYPKLLLTLLNDILRGNSFRKILQQTLWNLEKKSISPLKGDYDVAISYAGGMGIWNQIIIDKVKARKKICWVHGDYRVFGANNAIDHEVYCKFDSIVAVSEKTREILIDEIVELKDRVQVIYNLIDVDSISYQASLKKNIFSDNYFNVVSMSRLDKNKGFSLAIESIIELIEEDCPVRWYIIGEGAEYHNLMNRIKNAKVENSIFLLGKKMNPYPYLQEADLFLHPSFGEGKSIAVEEAKALKKAIIITDYPTARDQIENGVNGLIVPISIQGIKQGIMKLHHNEALRNKLVNNIIPPDKEITIKLIEQVLIS